MGGAATVFGVDYKGARDAVRQLQNSLSQQHPYTYNGMETIGAATTPIQLFKSAKMAPLARHNTDRLYNSIMDTGLATIGYSDLSDPYDVLKNAVKIGSGNAMGNFLGNRMLGRGLGNVLRTGYDMVGNIMSGAVVDGFYHLIK